MQKKWKEKKKERKKEKKKRKKEKTFTNILLVEIFCLPFISHTVYISPCISFKILPVSPILVSWDWFFVYFQKNFVFDLFAINIAGVWELKLSYSRNSELQMTRKHWLSSNLSWFVSLNNKAFGNLFCNPQKSSHTSPESSDSNNRGSTIAFTRKKYGQQ